jgi:integrase
MACDQIASRHIVAVVKELHNRPGLSSPATSLNYLSHLSAVYSAAHPTLDELDQLMQHFQDVPEAPPRTMPLHRVVAFAIFRTRRQAEILRMAWDDCAPEHKRVLVRKMKNPGQKGGIESWVELPDPCCAIIDAMPRKKAQIFSYNSDTVHHRFSEACKFLGIEDLHLHDLRHEGIGWLAEEGPTVPQLASATGHKTWKSLGSGCIDFCRAT